MIFQMSFGGLIMNIGTELYRVFREVAKKGSITAAAESLYVSQSAVSQSIKQLESQLGGKLFNRGKRGVTLTEAGRTLFGYADNAMILLENAEIKFSELKDLKKGCVRIAASDTVCNMYLLDKLNEFHRLYPDISIKVYNRTSDGSIELLKSGTVDMAFTNLSCDDESLESKPVMQVQDCFAVGGKYSFLARRTFSLGELEHYPLIMLERSSASRRMLDEFLQSKSVNAMPSIELSSVEMLICFAKIGLGIAAVPKQSAQSAFDQGELHRLRLSEPLPHRSLYVVTDKNIELSFAAQKFSDIIVPLTIRS